MSDFSPEDLQIQKAMLDVNPPLGGSSQLLNRLMALQHEEVAFGNESNKATPPQSGSSFDNRSKTQWLEDAFEEPNTASTASATVTTATNTATLKSATSSGQAFPRENRTRLGLLASAIVLLLTTALWWWQPHTFSNQLEWQVAQQIEQIEASPVAWQALVSLPSHLRPMMNQAITLEPLGFAKVPSKIAGENVRVYSFRNQEGKQILVFDLPGDPRREEYGAQLAPMNTSTGGWSFAVARTARSLVVFAVPGNQQYLLRHLRSTTVT
ncbi:MAG: hypothetical protein RLY14_858 [Planctomycetota bacterium]|jgi:hypothetical protein